MSTPPDPAAFERAKAAFLDGLAALQAGQFEQAELRFTESLAAVPGRVSTLLNLAAVRLARGHGAGALEAADAVLAAEPDNAEAHYHRAGACTLLGRHADALAGYERVLAVGGPPALAWLRHGQSLQALDRPAAALASYDRALAADPALAQAWSNRGNILREMGQAEPAIEAFRQALAHGADPALHGYYLASLDAQAVPATAPSHCVEDLFDVSADEFDAHLVGTLNYRAHRTLVEPIAALHPRRFASALDLGCGTGLCGPLVKPLCDRLEGVDIAERMLAKAARLGVYDRLVKNDITAELAATPDAQHDLVLAADVFIYIGELDAVFAGVRRVLRPSGLFCFSAEQADDAGPGFVLRPSLRYAQSERYLRTLAERHRFDLLRLDHATIREDQRVSIPGLFVYLAARQ